MKPFWYCRRWAARLVGVGAALLVCIGAAQAAPGLGTYRIAANTVTVAGVSSGGMLAVQLLVAYSRRFFGAAVFAADAYYCAQGRPLAWMRACMTGRDVPVDDLVRFTKDQAGQGRIDPTVNLGGKPIYLFSGSRDSVVRCPAMDALQQYLLAFTAPANITYDSQTPAEHAWVTPDGTNTCSTLAKPYLNACGTDPEQAFLARFYGTLNPRQSGSLGGEFVQFNQDEFCPAHDCGAISMDSTAWVFVPQDCARGRACRLVVALHGCRSNQQAIGTAFVRKSGIAEWADTNGIVVLFPQSASSWLRPMNPFGCWDWWGYTGTDYASHGGAQMTVIVAEIDRLTGAARLPAPRVPTMNASSDRKPT